MSSHFSVSSCLEKMENRDSDFRIMAVHDLQSELEKDQLKLDANYEKKLTSKTLSLLTDPLTSVQDSAVKCLGPLAKKVKEPVLKEIVDVLCTNLVDVRKDSGNIRDVASIGIRNVIENVPLEPATLSVAVYTRILPKLLHGMNEFGQTHPDIVFNSLDALSQLFERFGASQILSSNVVDSQKILSSIQPHLSSTKTTARKKAVLCLGFLAVSIPDKMFFGLVNELISGIKTEKKDDKLRTYISAVAAIGKSVGYRLTRSLDDICPVIMEKIESREDDELREQCFACLEVLLFRCPKEMSSFIPKIQTLGLEYIKYDPNWVEDDEEEEGEDEEDEDQEDEDEDFSDDEDQSWKVRRSAAKCLAMIIQTRPELLTTSVYQEIAPILISRFKEREPNVKTDIFLAFKDILRQASLVAKRSGDSSVFATARELAPKAVQALAKQLKEKQIPIRIAAFSLLREMAQVLPGSLGGELASALIPGIKLALATSKKTSPQLKIETLHFLRLYFQSQDASSIQAEVAPIAALLYEAATDNYFRTAAEGLKVCTEFAAVLRPNKDCSFDYKPYTKGLFDASLKKLKDQSVDQEVKEAAITCNGTVVSIFADQLSSDDLNDALGVLNNRLTNEITRLTAVKAFELIGNSSLKPNLPVLNDAVKQLASFLRKADRQLKQSSLLTLTVLVKNYGSQIETEQYNTLIQELVLLVNESDLHLTHLAFDICTAILIAKRECMTQLVEAIFPKIVGLIKSQLLQGVAAESLFNLLSQISVGSFEELIQQLVQVIPSPNENKEQDLSKQVLTNVARAIARLTLAANEQGRAGQIKSFTTQITNPKNETFRQLALYVIGDIGRNFDLSADSSLDQTIVENFSSSVEETRQAASYALGNIACGNLTVYLPKILSEIQKSPKISYLLIHSLREIIVKESTSSEGIKLLETVEKDILPLLFTHCQNKEEGTRNVVAECLGKFTLASPQTLIPKLVENLKSESPEERATIVSALKFAVGERSQSVDKELAPHLSQFLDLIKDKELNVRYKALLTLNYLVHNKPRLVRSILPNYLQMLYGEAILKPELIYELDLGPFKHKVDGGLEARKAAFETMYVLLENSLDALVIPDFVQALNRGLADVDDIKMLSHLMLGRLATLASSQLLESLDDLVDHLNETVTTKSKEGAVKQDVEKNEEIIKSALRAILLCSHIPNVESKEKFFKFFNEVVKVGELGEKLAALEGTSHDLMDL